MSEAKKGKTPWNKGLTKESDERVKKMSENKIGKVVSLKTCRKISKIIPSPILGDFFDRFAVMMDFGHVIVGDETGTLTGRVPGGTRSQFSLFDEHAVIPTLHGQAKE